MPKNLKNIEYNLRTSVSKNINRLEQEAKSEYQLGMVVFAYALQGDNLSYERSLIEMHKKLGDSSLDDPKKNSYKTWRLGRILLAADSIGDQKTFSKTCGELKALLTDKNTTPDHFSAWALGYLGALNKEEYKKARGEIVKTCKSLAELYQDAKSNNKTTKTDLQAHLSNALWALILAVQAAARAMNKEDFLMFLEDIKSLTKQKSLALALSTGLKREAESNDYPAWGIGIVRYAAATIAAEAVYDELDSTLKEAIAGANSMANNSDEGIAYGARAEATLAKLSEELAIATWAENKPNYDSKASFSMK